jgi:exportin-5
MKENAMRLMESGVNDLIKEAVHIKDGISRIVVEIIKREWPQQWPNLLAELEVLCCKGDAQTELVMFVMLRIVEDVAVLQTLEQNQRRKEIYQVYKCCIFLKLAIKNSQ